MHVSSEVAQRNDGHVAMRSVYAAMQPCARRTDLKAGHVALKGRDGEVDGVQQAADATGLLQWPHDGIRPPGGPPLGGVSEVDGVPPVGYKGGLRHVADGSELMWVHWHGIEEASDGGGGVARGPGDEDVEDDRFRGMGCQVWRQMPRDGDVMDAVVLRRKPGPSAVVFII